ncbi:MAG: hypothetical protein WCR28_03880 [Candidatus Izemoplasmatales bacterium]|jgi:hypothetical protein|nr:hypothetical protein [Candidatus Izemoplasmatales bacterium]MDY0373085.1 hypothetical protein [Candidatus Izemoplasmatales bacterium]NLF48567.1 hypothetical protein [Acholeplasmataceae bacterium]
MLEKSLKAIRLKDLLFVILYGVFLPTLLGILVGLIDYFLRDALNFTLGNILFWGVAIFTGKWVRRQYETPHLLYAILAGIGIFFSAMIIHTIPVFYALNGVGFQEIFDLRVYFSVMILVMNPISWIQNFSLDLALWLLILFVGTYLGVKRTIE